MLDLCGLNGFIKLPLIDYSLRIPKRFKDAVDAAIRKSPNDSKEYQRNIAKPKDTKEFTKLIKIIHKYPEIFNHYHEPHNLGANIKQ